MAGVVDEAVTGVRVVKAFAQEQREFDRLTEQAHELYQSRMRTARYNARYSSTLQVLPMLAQLGVLALGGWLALRGHITLGVFLAFASYLVQIITPVRLVASLLATTQQARAGAERVFELLDLQPARHRRARTPRPVADARGEIELDHVGFGHRGGPPTLHDVSLRIRPGERIGIVGASGSGKSTLAYLIARFYDPTSGTVRLDGADVRELTLESLRSTVNVVFEESFLFSTTIRENIAFARPGRDRRRDRGRGPRRRTPTTSSPRCRDGYDTVVGERGFTLSGGQRQRIALARAALAEPAGARARRRHVGHRRPHRGGASSTRSAAELGTRTTVLIAHRSSTLRLADRVLVLDGGRIVAEGTNAELWHTSELYRELLPGRSCRRSARDARRRRGRPGRLAVARRPDRRRARIAPRRAGVDRAEHGHRRWRRRPSGVIGARAGARRGDARAAGAASTPCRRCAAIPTSTSPTPRPRTGAPALRRLARRFRWAFVAVAVLVLVDAGTSLVGPLIIRHGLDAGVSVGSGAVLLAMCVAVPRACSCSAGATRSSSCCTRRGRRSGCCTRCGRERSPTCNGCRSTTTTGRWAGGS